MNLGSVEIDRIERNVYMYVCVYLQTPLYVASHVAQWVKNLPAVQEMQEMWVQSLGWENPLKDSMATHFSILA